MNNMFEGIALSTSNYDSLLLGWSAQSVQNSVTFSGGNRKYSSAAASARQTLADTYGWNITDGGMEVPSVTFTDGSGYSSSLYGDIENQPFGRFSLSASETGAELGGVTLTLNGTRSSLSNFKLWASSDNTFSSGEDTQLGSTVASDPGDGNTVSFSGFNHAIGTTAGYYFVTCDAAASASGSIQAFLADNASLTLTGGALSTAITNAPLSSDAVLDVPETSGKTKEYALAQNYPNPFNPSTTITYSLKEAGRVELAIYNTLGQLVSMLVSQVQPSGTYQVSWDGLDQHGKQTSSGMYFYKLKTNDYSKTLKMILMK
jgi:hypothetical protein